MLLSLDDYLHAENLRGQLIPSRDIDNQRILSLIGREAQHATPNQN